MTLDFQVSRTVRTRVSGLLATQIGVFCYSSPKGLRPVWEGRDFFPSIPIRNRKIQVAVRIQKKGMPSPPYMSCGGGEEGGAASKFIQSPFPFISILQYDDN